MIRLPLGPRLVILCWTALTIGTAAYAQYPSSCASVGQRANSNGQTNNCPNVNGTAYALNFLGTTYATVPTSSKTGNVTFSYPGMNLTLTPYAITQVWLTTTGTSILTTSFGPAGVPTISGNTTQVSYCFYGSNLPTAGTLSFQLTNPQTGAAAGICSYDASCNSNCTVVANPTTLPVTFESFTATVGQGGSVRLEWTTAQEENNKGFSIERSGSDSTFTPISFVPSPNAGGTSSTPTFYSYLDNDSHALGQWEYRLRQEDLNGHSVYSPVVTVDIRPGTTTPAVYAAGSEVKVQLPPGADYSSCYIMVYDTQGRILRRVAAGQETVTTIAGLPAHNVYYVVVRSQIAGNILTTKAVWIE